MIDEQVNVGTDWETIASMLATASGSTNIVKSGSTADKPLWTAHPHVPDDF